jgi:hypothetical protein
VREEAPRPEEESEWQDAYLQTTTTWERAALLGKLSTASLPRAQAFALQRLSEPQWVTVDRANLIDVLTKNLGTKESDQFVRASLPSASNYWLRYIVRNLVAGNFDRSEFVTMMMEQVRTQRYESRVGSVLDLLGIQKSSLGTVCPFFEELKKSSSLSGALQEILETNQRKLCGSQSLR